MKNYQFFIKSSKDDRLYTSDGRKVFFPDRYNFNDLNVGIVKCFVSKEFEKYGFVIGNMAESVGTLRDALDAGKVDLNKVISLRNLKGYEYWIEERENGEKYYCAFINGEVFDFVSEADLVLPSMQRYNLIDFHYNLRCQSDDNTSDVLEAIKKEYISNIISNLKKPEKQPLIESIIRVITYEFPASIKLYDNKVVVLEDYLGHYQFYYYDFNKNGLHEIPKLNTDGLSVEDLTDEIKSIILNYNLIVSNAGEDTKLIGKFIKCFNDCIEVYFMPTCSFSYSTYNCGYRNNFD